jgi:hypothetical protein
MPRPRREEFILDVRRSARTLQHPNAEAALNAENTDAIARILHRATLWLTPAVVEQYDPDDFAAWPSEQQNRLKLAVAEFRKTAGKAPPDQPPSLDQFMEGTKRFRELVQVLGSMVLAEWNRAIDAVETQAEEWSAKAEWRTRRVSKKMSESLVGAYEAPQLLIFAEPNLYALDPLARFVPGAQGAFDFSIQPSYYTTSMYRDDKGVWYVHLNVRRGVAHGRRVKWSRKAFHACIEQLKVLV